MMKALDPNSEVRWTKSNTQDRYPFPGAIYLASWPRQIEGEDDDSHYVVMWCIDNLKNFESDYIGIYLYTEEDAMAYKLRWE